MVNWSVYLPFHSNNTTHIKTMARKAPIDEGKSAWVCRRLRRVRHVSMMGKARRCKGAQIVQFSILISFTCK